MASEAERARTYRNYVWAYYVCCDHMGHTTVAQIRSHQSALPWYQNAGTVGVVLDDLKVHLFRGWLTLQTIQELPLGDYPELATGASMWLPVQAYYACHGIGLAALYALGGQMPNPSENSHRKFLNMASVSIAQAGLLLPPFSMRCSGDCTQVGAGQFHQTVATLAQSTAIHNLSTVTTLQQGETLIAKALRTTREALLSQRQQQRRKRLGRSRLTQAEKQAISNTLPDTTCFDLLYRLRICSNYEDADVFLFGQAQQDALKHCRQVIWLARAICAQLNWAIRRKLGAGVYQQLKNEFLQHG